VAGVPLSSRVDAHDRVVHFHPQRLFPRYSGLFSAASRIPGGLPLASRAFRGLAYDLQPSETENATADDLARVHVVVCGFPRTGTTFMQSAVDLALLRPGSCWKNHDVLALPTYAANGLPILVPIRHPRDTVASWCLYNSDEPTSVAVRRRVRSYMAWHRELKRHLSLEHVVVIDFADFTTDPYRLLTRLLPNVTVADLGTELTQSLIAADVQAANEREALDITQHNTPSTQRDVLMQLATRLFEELTDHIEVDLSALLQEIPHEA
jgi:hypothetical protein